MKNSKEPTNKEFQLRLNALREQELALLKGFKRPEKLSTAEDGRNIAQHAYLLNKTDVHKKAAKSIQFEGETDENNVAFHSEMPGVPLLGQLLYHSQVIVRIRDWRKERIVTEFGVTPEQLTELARNGWVVPVLYYSYGDDLYLRHKHLYDLFDSTQTGAQIDYFRQKFFMPEDVDETEKNYRENVATQLKKLKRKDLRFFANRQVDIEGCTILVSRHLAYIHSFTDLVSEANRITDKLKRSNLTYDETWNTVNQIMTLSRSNVHILSGAYGGHLSPDLNFSNFWRYRGEEVITLEQRQALIELELAFAGKGLGFHVLEDRTRLDQARKLRKAPNRVEWQKILMTLEKLRSCQIHLRERRVTRVALEECLRRPDAKKVADSVSGTLNYLRRRKKWDKFWEHFGTAAPIGLIGGVVGVIGVENTSFNIAAVLGAFGTASSYVLHFAIGSKLPGRPLADFLSRDGGEIAQRVGELRKP